MTLEQTKLKLLSHSRLMLIAAENSDWERFSALDAGWQQMLADAHEAYGSELSVIKNSLVDDNEKIQKMIQTEQKSVLTNLEKNIKGISSLKSYLK